MARRRRQRNVRWITERDDGACELRFFDSKGSERKLIRPNRAQAELTFLQLVGPPSKRHVGECRVSALAEWFKLKQRKRLVATDDDYETIVDWFLPQYGDKLISEITLPDLAGFRKWLHGLNKPNAAGDTQLRYGKYHIDNCVRVARRMFRLAAESGLLDENPGAMLGGRPRNGRGRGAGRRVQNHVKVRPPTDLEIAGMYANVLPWSATALSVATETGARKSELDALIEEDIEYSHRAVRFDHTLVNGQRVLIEHEQCRRTVPVSDRCIAIAIRYAVVQRDPGHGQDHGRKGFLFPCIVSGKTFLAAALGPHGAFPKSAEDREKLPPYTPVALSDYAAIKWIEQDVSLKIIAHWLGRLDIATLERRFRKYLSLKSLREQRGRFDTAIGRLLDTPVKLKAPYMTD